MIKVTDIRQLDSFKQPFDYEYGIYKKAWQLEEGTTFRHGGLYDIERITFPSELSEFSSVNEMFREFLDRGGQPAEWPLIIGNHGKNQLNYIHTNKSGIAIYNGKTCTPCRRWEAETRLPDKTQWLAKDTYNNTLKSVNLPQVEGIYDTLIHLVYIHPDRNGDKDYAQIAIGLEKLYMKIFSDTLIYNIKDNPNPSKAKKFAYDRKISYLTDPNDVWYPEGQKWLEYYKEKHGRDWTIEAENINR